MISAIPPQFQGLTALVTGGTSGIGDAIARGLAAQGARVVRHGLQGGELDHDLSVSGAGAALAREALELGQVDIVVLSASIQVPADWNEHGIQSMEHHLRTNLIEPFDLVRHLLPGMIERGWGRVLAIGSVQQSRPHPRMLPYAASKSAQFSMVRSLAAQVAQHGVTVNSLSPGVIRTPRNDAALADPAYQRRTVDAIPVGRLGTPEDCVPAALLLCSRDGGAYITGQDLVVDGGFTL
jgi:glucose 1-dehydrogenase